MSAKIQRDGTDCGAVCLAAVAEYFGIKRSVAYFRAQIGTSRQGSTALGLIQAARKVGLYATGVRGTFEQASKVPLPAIAHCLIGARIPHFIVVTNITSSEVEVMDPAKGRTVVWPATTFLSAWTGILLLFESGEQMKRGNGDPSALRRFLDILAPHRKTLLLTATAAVGAALLTLGTAICVQVVLDEVIPTGNRMMLHRVVLCLLAIAVVRLSLTGFQSILTLRTTTRMDATLMMGYYRHLLRLPQSFFDTMRIGEISSRLADATKVRSFLSSSFLHLVLNPLLIAFSLTGMWLYSAKIALISTLLLPVSALLYWQLAKYTKISQRDLMERAAAFGAQFNESLAAQSVIRRFGLEAKTERATGAKLTQLLSAARRSSLASLTGGLIIVAVTQLYLIGIIWIGATMVLELKLTLGELVACCALAACLIGPMTSLIGICTSIQDTLVATERLFEIMDLDREDDTGTCRLLASHDSDLSLVDISFHYAGRCVTLSDITISFRKKSITVLSGETGCGKSSLLALIQRLYRPERGTICIGQDDVYVFSLDSYRRTVAVVPQQTVLLSGTVLENLTPADSQPDMQRLLNLCRDVGILDTIENLPKGFMTYLTENGSNLSGGQRQRLAVVRAIYLNAPILLLDEPTASLDSVSEGKILTLLQKIRDEGKTIVIAAHHPAVLACADRVVEMAAGRILNIIERHPSKRMSPTLTVA